VKLEAFEARLLSMWVGTRVPLTRANIQVVTGATRKEVDRYTDQLVASQVLELDVTDDGDMVWRVLGADRPRTGPTSAAEVARLEQVRSELGTASRALELVRPRGKLVPGEARKSLIASGALSFFFGPLGWLYAAPLKEAIPAALVYALAWAIIPKALLLPVMGLLTPLIALVGIGYAWRHNQTGERTSLLPPKSE
jgi:hypothetical protein